MMTTQRLFVDHRNVQRY